MSEYTRRGEADELREKLNECHEEIANYREALKARDEEIRKMKEEIRELKEINEAYEKADREKGKYREMAYKDGIIYGLKFAIRANGVSGGEVQ